MLQPFHSSTMICHLEYKYFLHFLSLLYLAQGSCPSENQTTRTEHCNKEDAPMYTTLAGLPVDDMATSMTAGPRGPIVIDPILMELMAGFNRERIPERTVHAKGAGAFGYFVVTKPEIVKYCRADLFSEVGKKTTIAVRFSTGSGELGSADTVRELRGFAVKFYTKEGIWDLAGNNSPIFWVRDPMLVPSITHAQKRNPQTHLKDANSFWDFLTLQPQTVHQSMITFSGRGIPDGYRHMDGFGSHTFKLVNAEGHAVYCKFHYLTDQGIKNLNNREAATIRANNPDYAIKDLFSAIAAGNHPSWTLYIQTMTFEQAEKLPWNPFDLTKTWPEDQYPLTEVGRLVLDRNPSNYFAEVEQIAFSPANMVPGIEASPDKILQARLFSYSDAQRYRLGMNHLQLPVNCPQGLRVNSIHRDGFMRGGDNGGDRPDYYPNSYNGGRLDPRGRRHPYPVSGDVMRHNDEHDDNFSQPKELWHKGYNSSEKENLVQNIADHVANAEMSIQKRVIEMYCKVAEDFAQSLEEALKNKNSSTAYMCNPV